MPTVSQRGRAERLIADVGRRYAASYDLAASYEIYDARQRPALDAVAGYVRELPEHVREGRSLVLVGPSGVGKDHLAAHVLLRAILDCDLGAGASTAQGIVRAMRGSGADEMLDRLRHRHLYLVSDLTAGGATMPDWQLLILLDAVNARYAECLPLVATMNATDRGEAERFVGVPIVDRLYERATIVECVWPSYRPRQAGT